MDPNYGAGGPGGGFGGFDMGDIDLGDIFGSFFGGGFGGFGGGTSARRNGPQKGESLRASLTISFEEAAFGCEKEINLNRTEQCEACHGSGCGAGHHGGDLSRLPGHRRGPGPAAHRRLRLLQHRPLLPLPGHGQDHPHPLQGLRRQRQREEEQAGHGQHPRRHRRRAGRLPAGPGQRREERRPRRRPDRGGPVKPHPQFQRDGTTVLYEQPVTFYQAAMGAELEIPTIDGKVKYTLPAGTQTGTTFRLRGKGIPELRGRGRGDQYVTVRVQIPTSLNGEQKEALRAFAEAMGEDVPEESGLKGFFDKHKKRK